jgi:VWFA-related protein
MPTPVTHSLPTLRFRQHPRNLDSLRRLPTGATLGAAALALLLALVTLPQASRAQQTPPQSVFGETIEVRAVQVEVVVTDRQGQRIEGLGPEDFRLLVDDEAAVIDYFSEVRGGALQAAPETAGGTGPGELEPALEPAAGGSVGRSLLVFIDDYFTDRRFRHRLLGNLADNLETLAPGDRMAIVRFEGYGLEVLAPWTDSKTRLREALVEARKRTPRDLIRKTQAGVPANPVMRARLLGKQITEVTGAMGVAMRSFSDTPGRKLFVPVTAGWPFDPVHNLAGGLQGGSAEFGDSFALGGGEPGTQSAEARFFSEPLSADPAEIDPDVDDLTAIADAYRYRSVELLRPLIDTANLLGWTVYPMDIGGFEGAERASLWITARETGGRLATVGAANTLPLEPVVDDTGSYYVLGFTPERARDDARHRVRVEVVREGLDGVRVRHRRDFRDLSRRAQRALEVEAALLLGEGGDLEVRFGEVAKGGRGAVELPVILTIPMDWVTMVPTGKGRYTGELELRVAALDARGGRSEIPAIPIQLSGGEPPPGSHATYETAIRLRRAEQRVVLYLYDTVSGEVRSTSLEFNP